MPVARKIDLLPNDVRTELNERLRLSGFGEIGEATQWLRSKGYAIGKSAVGMHAKSLKLLGGRDWATEEDERFVAVRMGCLGAAAASCERGAPVETVLARADAFLKWAYLRNS